jgi:glutamine amidotransferase-like protein
MYAIAGYVGLEPGVVDETVVRRMARQLPPHKRDGEGIVVHGKAGQAGALETRPPLVVAYAGEIFNDRELREELAALGHAFTGDGMAEVVLAGWAQWGEAALDRCNGRFALAILDQATGEVTLARDPIGGPALYYAADGAGRVAFASELRAVIAAGVVPRRADDATIRRYLSSGVHDDSERTFVDQVSRVLPGELVVITPAGQLRRETYTRLYQELDLLATTRRPNTPTTRAQVREMLAEAVQRRAGADTGATPTPEASTGAEDLAGFVACQQEPTGSLAAYHDYRLTREISRHGGALLDRSAAGDAVADYLQRRQPPAGHRLRRRAAAASPAAAVLTGDAAAAPHEPPIRSAEDLFRRGLPAVLRHLDRNAAWFSVPRHDPYLDPHVLRTMWSLDLAALRALTHSGPSRQAPPGLPPQLRPVAEELFESQLFGSRPYLDQSAVLTSYGTGALDPDLCWRLVNLELWLREFVDRDPTIPPASTFVAHYPKPVPTAAAPAPPAPEPTPAAAGAAADDDSLITVDVGA